MKRYLSGALFYGVVTLAVGCARSPVTDEGYTPDKIAEINVQLGAAYLKEGNYETALAKTRRALAIDPNYPSAHNVMGLIYNRLGENQKAEEYFKKAFSLDPNDSGLLNNYGQFLCQMNRFEEAQPMFQKALANPLYATPEVAHANAGVCALRARDLVKAEGHLRSALVINPRISTALLDMAGISYEQRRYAQAHAYLQRYLAVTKHTPRSLWLGIRIGRMLGDHNAVASYALALKSKYPDSRETRLLLESEEQ